MFPSLAAAVLLATPSAAAGDEKPSLKLGGVILAHYGFHLADGSPNDFDLDRVYVVANATLTERLATKVTLDADRIKEQEDDLKTRVYVKHAYLEAKAQEAGMKFRFGMIDTPWAGYYDNFWEHRYLGESFARQFKVVDTADLGVGAMGEHAKGRVSWHAVVVNGEGYSKMEVDAGKTVQARATLDPIAGAEKGSLPISGFVSYALPGAEGADAAIVYAGAVGLRKKPIIAWVEYLGSKAGDVSGSGFSVTAIPRVPRVIDVIARVDRWDPDTETADDETLRIVGGVAHDFYEKVSLAATFEQETAGTAEPEQAVFLRMQAGF